MNVIYCAEMPARYRMPGAKGTLCNDRSGGAVSPLTGPWQSAGGFLGVKPPEALTNLHLTDQKEAKNYLCGAFF